MIHILSAICTGTLLGIFYGLAMHVAGSDLPESQGGRREPLIFLTAVAAAYLCSYVTVPPAMLGATVILISSLSVCVITDLRFGYIFDVVTLPAMAMLLACGYIGGTTTGTLEGGAICSLIILTIYALSRGRGIGIGDLKLAACIGLTFGVFGGVIAIGASFIAGAIHGIYLLIHGRVKKGDALRFAPYLAVGCAISVALTRYGG